jgi:tetratricopeptide (TPR) repeat protein
MDVTKIFERYERVFYTLMVALAAIVSTVTAFFHVLREPWEWGWSEWTVALIFSLGVIAMVRRSLRGHSSRLLDPDALRLDPQSPDQLFGRAEDLQKLLNVVRSNPLVFLISESGCGKTALLRAGVEQHPDFIGRFLPIYVDMSALDWEDGPVRELCDGFSRALPADDPARSILEPQSGPRDYVEVFRNYYARSMRRPLLLLDQFDDYQTQSKLRDKFFPPETQQWRKADEILPHNKFWRVVRACVGAKVPVLHVIVAVRDEASPGLDCIRFSRETPQFGLLRLPSGLVGQIIDRLTQRAEGQPVVMADAEHGWIEVRERLVDDLSGPILPQQLKIVLGGLRTLRDLTPKSYMRAGRIAGLEAAFVRDAIERAAKASGLRDAEVLQLTGALVDHQRQPPDRFPPQSVADLASKLSMNVAAMESALAALARGKIVRLQGDTAGKGPAWQLDHGYLALPILRLERDRDRWRMLLAERAHLHMASDWRHRWQTLLPLKEQAWLLVARLRGQFRYGEYRLFALKSMLRSVPVLVLLAALSIAGVVTSYEGRAALQNQVEAKIAEYQRVLREAESTFLYRSSDTESLRLALDKCLRVFSVRDEVSKLHGRPPDTAVADEMDVLEMTGILRAELGDTDASLRDFQRRDELAKSVSNVSFSPGAGGAFGIGAYGRVVLDAQIDLLEANDDLVRLQCAAKSQESARPEYCSKTPEERAEEDIERNKKYIRMMDYLTRAHPYERDFEFLSRLLESNARRDELLKEWDQARQAWEERVVVAQRRLEWEQKKRHPHIEAAGITIPDVDTVAQIANRVGKPLMEARRDLANFHLRRDDYTQALKPAKDAFETMTTIKEAGADVSDAEEFGIRKIFALVLAGTGANDEGRAVFDLGANAITKSSFNDFLKGWDKLQHVYRDVAKTRDKLSDDVGAVKNYDDLVWLLKAEMGVFKRRGLSEELALAYEPLSWHQILSRDFDAAIATTRNGLSLDVSEIDKVGLKVNLAHALLLEGRTDEAMALYEASKTEVYSAPDSGAPRLVAHVVLDDFEEFAKRDLTAPQMAAIRASMLAVVDEGLP